MSVGLDFFNIFKGKKWYRKYGIYGDFNRL